MALDDFKKAVHLTRDLPYAHVHQSRMERKLAPQVWQGIPLPEQQEWPVAANSAPPTQFVSLPPIRRLTPLVIIHFMLCAGQ